MIPMLFGAAESAYTTHGLGPIRDATSCLVTEEANGAFELKLSVPCSSPRLAQLVKGNQILVPPNPYDRPQPFRIQRVTKGLRGEMDVYAQHLCYDLAGVPINRFFASTAAQAIGYMNSNRLGGDSFVFSTDLVVSNPMVVSEPTVAWELLGGGENTLTYNYGGELRFDRRSVQLLQSRGADRGFVIAYGKNLTGLTHEESIEGLYTGVLPYWTGGEDTLVLGEVQTAIDTLGFTKILPVDMSADFEEAPSVAQLNAAGVTYIREKKIGEPTLRIKASFVPPGSRGIRALEDVRLWDRVTLRHERLQIDVEASVVRTVYDVLRERYQNVEIGNRLVSVAQTIAAPVSRIADGAVKTQNIAPGAVRASRIGAGAISGSKLADNSVSVMKIVDGAVVTEKIATDAVTAAQLLNGAVTVNKIAAGAVVTDKIATDAVTATKILAGAVTTAKILDKAVAYAKLSNSLQVFYNDTIAANAIFTGVIYAAQSVSCSTLVVTGHQYHEGVIAFVDGLGNTRSFNVLRKVED